MQGLAEIFSAGLCFGFFTPSAARAAGVVRQRGPFLFSLFCVIPKLPLDRTRKIQYNEL